jgi:multidrug efflux pump subunit AcrA (membrane-fusion protein)
MRFLLRGLTGLALFAAALALVALGGWRLSDSLRAPPPGPDRAAEERSVVVPTAILAEETLRPVIEAYGAVRSWRTLDLRAPVSGRIVEIAERFRDGGRVSEGALLLRIDPADYESAVADAEAGLAEARADVAEAREGKTAAEIELDSAETQRDLRAATLDRQRGLAERGVASTVAVDEAELALAAAEQAVAARRQAVVTARLRIDRAALAVDRAELALAEARRALSDTEIVAPFAGVLTEVDAILGDLVATNESVGRLIDPEALEAAFRVDTAEFARLRGPGGLLRPLPVRVELPLGGGETYVAQATLDRAGAVTGAGRTGRELFARIQPDPETLLRPDDFVTVRLREPALEGVAAIPAAAATEDGRILILNAEGQLEEVRVVILRRARDRLIVGDAPFGATYVTERSPQLGPGLKATPRGADNAPETVALDPARREKLLAYVRAAPQMGAERRAELLDLLSRPEPPKEIVERLEARMARG